MVSKTERAWQALGQVSYGATEDEKKSIVFRRSSYVVQDLKAGDVIPADAVRSVRPGFGVAPKHLEDVVGRVVKQDVKQATAIGWEQIVQIQKDAMPADFACDIINLSAV
jgi:sialic acid synthase SpsE